VWFIVIDGLPNMAAHANSTLLQWTKHFPLFFPEKQLTKRCATRSTSSRRKKRKQCPVDKKSHSGCNEVRYNRFPAFQKPKKQIQEKSHPYKRKKAQQKKKRQLVAGCVDRSTTICHVLHHVFIVFHSWRFRAKKTPTMIAHNGRRPSIWRWTKRCQPRTEVISDRIIPNLIRRSTTVQTPLNASPVWL
jgi:hypothetical protein